MVFARTKLMIHDYCMEIKPKKLVLNYSGPNPQIAVKKYIEVLKRAFKVSDAEVQEKNFNWDRSGKEEKFSIDFELRKDMDKNSYLWVQGDIKGMVRPSDELGKEGNVTIRIDGAVRAEYPQDTFWQRSLFYEMFRVFYHKVLYISLWEKYMAECRDMMRLFIDEMKSYFGLLRRGAI